MTAERVPYRCGSAGWTDHPGDGPEALTGRDQADEWAAAAREQWCARCAANAPDPWGAEAEL
jgi:hypothetical protein